MVLITIVTVLGLINQLIITGGPHIVYIYIYDIIYVPHNIIQLEALRG